jgi:hypothetical protein
MALTDVSRIVVAKWDRLYADALRAPAANGRGV